MKKISLYIQILLSIAILVLFIIFIFKREVLSYLELVVGINLFVMAYNNYKFYKREKFTIYYIVFGVVMLVLAIFRFIGV